MEQKKKKPKRPLPGYARTLSRESKRPAIARTTREGPRFGAELQGDKERKPEDLQQGNDIPPPRTAQQASDSNA
ncbi:hypothetical protein NDU88_005089 [Pleurodeles waltl]|uniref:Uncharacterized protein n=1 Tax=Pleurodeles waltl TaxID=8319 RepID=A0AAV7V5F2_PLEWA|nr:hypothetical protein NDU88_005089 [Pleurodeles waltl]